MLWLVQRPTFPNISPLISRLSLNIVGIYLKLSTNVFGVTEELNFWNPSFRWVFIGRTLDIARFLRLFGVYKYIIKRTGDIAPALMGTIMLVYSAIHIYTYIGMMLFGNMVTPGDTPDIEAFYDLNNFNSYSKVRLSFSNIYMIPLTHFEPLHDRVSLLCTKFLW